MPNYSDCTMDFMKKCLACRKKLLRLNEVKQIRVPRLKEFCADKIYLKSLSDEIIRDYLPDGTDPEKPKRTVSKAYLFNGKYLIHHHRLLHSHQHSQTRVV